MRTLPVCLFASLLAVATAAGAKPEGKGKDKDKGGPGNPPAAAQHAPKGGGKPEFAGDERSTIKAWFGSHPEARNQLPPGLAKQKKIPPGWQKKLARGQVIPQDIWEFRVPLPHEVILKLPPPPPGVVTVRIQDRIVRVHERNREVVDIFGL